MLLLTRRNFLKSALFLTGAARLGVAELAEAAGPGPAVETPAAEPGPEPGPGPAVETPAAGPGLAGDYLLVEVGGVFYPALSVSFSLEREREEHADWVGVFRQRGRTSIHSLVTTPRCIPEFNPEKTPSGHVSFWDKKGGNSLKQDFFCVDGVETEQTPSGPLYTYRLRGGYLSLGTGPAAEPSRRLRFFV